MYMYYYHCQIFKLMHKKDTTNISNFLHLIYRMIILPQRGRFTNP